MKKEKMELLWLNDLRKVTSRDGKTHSSNRVFCYEYLSSIKFSELKPSSILRENVRVYFVTQSLHAR